MSEKQNKRSVLKIILIVLGVFIFMGIIGSALGGDDEQPAVNVAKETVETTEPKEEIEKKETKKEVKEPDELKQDKEEVEPIAEEPSIDMGKKNALGKAKDYLAYSAFSYSGLIEQLEFEGFSTEDATYGADNVGTDWNEQATLKAQQYLDYSSFSRTGLIEQLEYEGFTREQAEYGASAVGY